MCLNYGSIRPSALRGGISVKASRILLSLLLVAVLLFCMSAVAQEVGEKGYVDCADQIKDKKVELYASSTSSLVVATLKCGDEVTALGQARDSRHAIRTKDGKEGWTVSRSIVWSGIKPPTAGHEVAKRLPAKGAKVSVIVTSSKLWQLSGGSVTILGGTSAGVSANSNPDAPRMIQALDKYCPGVAVTADPTKAVYILVYDYDIWSSGNREKATVYDRKGSVIYGGQTWWLRNIAKNICKAIETDLAKQPAQSQ